MKARSGLPLPLTRPVGHPLPARGERDHGDASRELPLRTSGDRDRRDASVELPLRASDRRDASVELPLPASGEWAGVRGVFGRRWFLAVALKTARAA